MNSWQGDQQGYNMMPNMMGMNSMMGNMMPPGNMPPMVPPSFMMGDYNNKGSKGNSASSAMGDGKNDKFNNSLDDQNREGNKDQGKSKGGKWPKQRDRGESNDPMSGNKSTNRNENRRDRVSKWDNSSPNDKQWPTQQQSDAPMPVPPAFVPGPNNMMMPGNMMPYGTGPMMPQQSMDMSGMPNMAQMPPPMPNMMNYGMNMMPNMMMGQPMPMIGSNQPIYLSNAALLPPLPNTSLPGRREKPLGCKTIFVGGFPMNVTKEAINEMFQRFGVVVDIKLNQQGVAQVRFDNQESVEQAFFFSGCRFKWMDQSDMEATMIFVDYAANSEDKAEYDKNVQQRPPTPPYIEPCTPSKLNTISEKIRSDTDFIDVAPTVVGWLERGECNKKTVNTFYNMVQASNNHLRRLFSEKMQIDEEFQTMKASSKEKFLKVIKQFEQVSKIVTTASQQGIYDLFSKQQRRNIDMWQKMTEEVPTIKEEFNAMFDEEDPEHAKKTVPIEKYDSLKKELDALYFEIEGYKNEAHLAKDEAERKFEKFKAQYVAQQSLQQPPQPIYPPLPPPLPKVVEPPLPKSKIEPPTPDEIAAANLPVTASEAKIISTITAYLLIHPNGATMDHILQYIKIVCPFVTQGTVNHVLQKYSDVFMKRKFGKGGSTEYRWCYLLFDRVKIEGR